MKKGVIKSLKKIVRPFANKLGFYENRSGKSSLIVGAFRNLKSNNFYPKLILDIGANRGTWTRLLLSIFPESKYVLIEPQNELEEFISDIRKHADISFFPIGLGNENMIKEFSINVSDDSSSFKRVDNELPGYEFKNETISIEMKTTDKFLKDEFLTIPDVVKIDAEGLDLEVLQGANSIFGTTEVILVEASVNQKAYQNSLLKVMQFMDSKGYEIYDLTDLNRPTSNGLLWLVEVMFIKKNSKFV